MLYQHVLKLPNLRYTIIESLLK